MIKVLVYLIIVLIGLIISPYLSGFNGYLYLAIGEYELETSLIFALFAAIFFYAVLVCIEWVVVWLLNVILSSRLLPEKWRKKKARKHTLQGALALAEENWTEAEQAMARGADKGEIPVLNLLAAARAAQHQNNLDARDHYLLEAEKDPLAYKAVQTTRLRYLMQQGELQQAREILEKLNPDSKSKAPLLRLARELYQLQQDWHALKLLLPILKKRNLLTQEEFNQLNLTASRALLATAAAQNEQELEKAWHWLSRGERKQAEFIAQYALGLAKFERGAEAKKLLLKALKQDVQTAIFDALPQVLSPSDVEARKQLFDLDKHHGDNRDYQACIARLYDQSKEYRESKKWWQRVCETAPTKQDWIALAEAQEHLGEQNSALQSYRKAATF
ncbi:heme biosynthesis protein HemY [Shewanella sp. AS1]|uniref:heme biosynthesis HemY N-terminal domain-containing protein n=1 Tax=Shewanella sp. AS1 TaxID=2907626 RepID=UPI001F401F49|nr:heme biosynthesis HemY N-terminal domain-containing protein [Shewanella sp. AS1]MCE9680453.1 heme biosynthesis protein HemY [Shewanella sp. AS1]